MSRSLPPLNALRAFEAAARHLSLTRAAAELHVTPAAISHQVKALETWLGVPLFRRLNRAILLTDAGQGCFKGLHDGFDRLAEAVEAVRVHAATGPLTVSVAPSFASKWLVPRLDGLRRAHPQIDIRIDASTALVDFARDDIDVAVRYGRGRYPGLRVERLLTEEVFPVCSPKLRRGPPPLRKPQDLRRHTLLHSEAMIQDASWPTWQMWLLAAGVHDVDAGRGSRFTTSSMAIEAAIDGQGVALASSVLAADDLRARRLVRPFAMSLAHDFSYYVVCPEATANRPKVAAFRNWVLEEARRHEAAAGA